MSQNENHKLDKTIQLLLKDQIKRKQIIHQIQIIASKNNYNLITKPEIYYENIKYEWFVNNINKPTLIDSLYYLYFWLLFKGKYLLDDFSINDKNFKDLLKENNKENINKKDENNHTVIKKKSRNLTNFKKDILKAKKSVNDLRSEFTKLIDENNKEKGIVVKSNNSSPMSTPKKSKFPISNTNDDEDDETNQVNFDELHLIDSPYIKNVLKFKFEMSVYLNVLINTYQINKENLNISKFVDILTVPKILINENKINWDNCNKILGFEYLNFLNNYQETINKILIKNASPHLQFIFELLMNHLQTGLIWDFQDFFQKKKFLFSANFKRFPERLSLFLNFSKNLNNFIFEIFNNKKSELKNLINEFNSKNPLKINYNLNLNFFLQNWKFWNELDFILLNNYIGEIQVKNPLTEKRIKFNNLKKGEEFRYFAWDLEKNKKCELVYIKD